MDFLMIDGEGDPNTAAEFQSAVDALYGVSYAAKFMVKEANPDDDYVVMPLQGLWWADDMQTFADLNKDEWKWTMMIVQPEVVTPEILEAAVEQTREKKPEAPVNELRFEEYDEGLSVQLMHIGPYSEEGPTIERLHSFMQKEGYTFAGKHHEIYIGDPNRAKPENLKTIIRQPVKRI
jgi:hypothetical protein